VKKIRTVSDRAQLLITLNDFPDVNTVGKRTAITIEKKAMPPTLAEQWNLQH
jgi:hypothetical protein